MAEGSRMPAFVAPWFLHKALLCQRRPGIDLHGNFRERVETKQNKHAENSRCLAEPRLSPVERVVPEPPSSTTSSVEMCLSTWPNGHGVPQAGLQDYKAFCQDCCSHSKASYTSFSRLHLYAARERHLQVGEIR